MTKKIKQIVSLSLAGVLLILFGTLFFMISINTADELPRILEYKRSRLSDGVTFSVYEKLPNESFTEKLAIDTELDTQTVDALGEVKPVLVNEYFFDTYGIAVDGSAITSYQITAHTPAAVISDRAARDLAPDESVIGRTITLYDKEFTIIGIYKKPAGFPRGISSDFYERVYIPYTCRSGYQELAIDTLAAPKGSYAEKALALLGMTQTDTDYYLENDIAVKHDIVANFPTALIFALTVVIAVYCIKNLKRLFHHTRRRLSPEYERYTVPQIIKRRKWFLLARMLIAAAVIAVPIALLVLFPPKLVLPLSYIPYDNIFDIGWYYNAFRSAVQISNSDLTVGNLYYSHLFTATCITALVLFILTVVLMLFTAVKLDAVVFKQLFKEPQIADENDLSDEADSSGENEPTQGPEERSEMGDEPHPDEAEQPKETE